MSFNFSQLQQSVDRLLINSSEAISKLVDLSIAPAGDVTVQYYDKNGDLVTQTTPNMMKVLNTVQTNINSYMQKTVYVDPNGDDNNDGTSQRPVKTIRKAVEDLIPSGGYGYVVLRQGTHTLNTHVNVLNKAVVLALEGNCTLTTQWYNEIDEVTIYRFRLHNSFLRISSHDNANATIYVPPKPQNKTVRWYTGLIEVPDLFTSTVILRPSDASNFSIELNDTPFIKNIGGILQAIFHLSFIPGYNLNFNLKGSYQPFLIQNQADSISLVRFFTNGVLKQNNNIVYDDTNDIRNVKALLGNIIYYPNTNIPANYIVSNPANFNF